MAEAAGCGEKDREQTTGELLEEWERKGLASDRWVEGEPRFPVGWSGLQKAELLFFLTLDAVASPGDSLQPFVLDLFVARHAKPVIAVLQAFQSLRDELQDAAVVVALVE